MNATTLRCGLIAMLMTIGVSSRFDTATEVRSSISQVTMRRSTEPVTTRRDLKDYVLFPFRLYRSDPYWVPPLIGDRMKQWGATQKDKKVPKAAALGDALAAKLTAIEGEIYQYRNRSSQDPLNYPIRLNNKLAALQGVVEGGDGRPTEQSYTVFKELSSRLDAELAKLDAVLKTDLPPFNKEIAAKKLKPVL